jgi:hypothetical protein
MSEQLNCQWKCVLSMVATFTTIIDSRWKMSGSEIEKDFKSRKLATVYDFSS